MKIQIKRVYEEPAIQDGTRVLVDRLWPRGLSQQDISLDFWARELAPSTALRKWFDHDPDKFEKFTVSYRKELVGNQAHVDSLLKQIDRHKRLTLLYAAKDLMVNHTVVLRSFLAEKS